MTNAEILTRAIRGRAVLRERQKSITKEHTERSKKLEHLVERITSAELSKQLQLSGTDGLSLSDDLRDLLENPSHGL